MHGASARHAHSNARALLPLDAAPPPPPGRRGEEQGKARFAAAAGAAACGQVRGAPGSGPLGSGAGTCRPRQPRMRRPPPPPSCLARRRACRRASPAAFASGRALGAARAAAGRHAVVEECCLRSTAVLKAVAGSKVAVGRSISSSRFGSVQQPGARQLDAILRLRRDLAASPAKLQPHAYTCRWSSIHPRLNMQTQIAADIRISAFVNA